MLECVLNLSEGSDRALVAAIAGRAGASLLDAHLDPWHNRAVLTLGGNDVLDDAKAVTVAAIERLDVTRHVGAHPRLGVVDVVPFSPIDDEGLEAPQDVDLTEALAARLDYARWASETLALPCFFYGPERTLPFVRRNAFFDLAPDLGPTLAHPRAGAVCVGARPVLVAYNLWLADDDLVLARRVATSLRSPHVRALGLDLDGRAQVSCNLVAPAIVGPAQVFDAVAALAAIERAELVGLVPASILAAVPPGRHRELGLDEDRTIEARLPRHDPRRVLDELLST